MQQHPEDAVDSSIRVMQGPSVHICSPPSARRSVCKQKESSRPRAPPGEARRRPQRCLGPLEQPGSYLRGCCITVVFMLAHSGPERRWVHHASRIAQRQIPEGYRHICSMYYLIGIVCTFCWRYYALILTRVDASPILRRNPEATAFATAARSRCTSDREHLKRCQGAPN